MLIFSIGFGLLYIYRYWFYSSPPRSDILSPAITLFMAINIMVSYPISKISPLLIMTIVIDSIADFFMDVHNLGPSIILFSLGHICRQVLFSHVFNPPETTNAIMCLVCVTALCVLQLSSCSRRKDILMSTLYGCILSSVFIDVSLSMKRISIGYILFILSDLIILIEILFCLCKDRTVPTQTRVILVPLLYWTAEYMIMSDIIPEIA